MFWTDKQLQSGCVLPFLADSIAYISLVGQIYMHEGQFLESGWSRWSPLKLCAYQLATVFTHIFNISLKHSSVPNCFKETSINPIPRKNKMTCLNDHNPVTLLSTIMKWLERLVMAHICTGLLDSLDLLYTYYDICNIIHIIHYTTHNIICIQSYTVYIYFLHLRGKIGVWCPQSLLECFQPRITLTLRSPTSGCFSLTMLVLWRSCTTLT